MLARLVFVGALLGATCAWGQQPESDPPEATAAEIARASATADRLIAEAEAAGVFINTTDSGIAQVTHAASGMTCLLSDNGVDRVHIFPPGAQRLPRGDDISCVSREMGVEFTLYATRYRPMPSEREIMAGTVHAIQQRWPDAAPFEGSVAMVSTDGREPLSAAFAIDTDAGRKVTLVLILHIGEWGYKARATGPADDPMLTSVLAGMAFASALMNVESAASE